MKTFSITDIGQKRSMNQDCIFSSEKPVGNLPNLFIVADGMGGHKAGDYASQCAVKTIVDSVTASKKDDAKELFNDAIYEANRNIILKAKEDEAYEGMGTTIVACSVFEDRMLVANVGDSRLYVINKDIKQITTDHSLVEEMVKRGEVDRLSAREHPDKHIITRAVGVSSSLEVDFFNVKIKKKDNIILCSDGLSNMVDDRDIRQIVLTQRDVAEKAEKLIETANRNGGLDNISVIVIDPYADEV
ncbi:MAG: Stp1/IreP family PP2C-type Ser/Thr phosphatase [Lachnospiraceae bacterium]|nr:Stp1/IreP family PP2C-type Ser/Thr phosphatase [Lachnospiraceae bacterium]